MSDTKPSAALTTTVHELVARRVESMPGACAVREALGGSALTYAALWERAGWLAAELADRGVGRADLVAVALDRGVDLIVALLGIGRAGAAYLPLDGHAPADRVASILAEASTRRVVAGPASAGRLLPPGLDLVLVPEAGRRPRDVGAGRDDPVYVSYTSGSTGRPKGVVVPHRAVLRLTTAPRFCTIDPGDAVANMSNIAFDATTFEVWSTLVAGGTIVVLPAVTDVTIAEWVALVRAERVTTMFLTTSLFHGVARERPDAFGSLRTLVVGGEQLDAAAARAVLAAGPPARLVNGYGPTEATTFATYYDCTADSLAGVDRVPIGHALQETTLHVLDADLRPAPPGAEGELCIGGPGVATGYLGRPDLTAERFVADPSGGGTVYRTGDVVRQRPDGALELLGRRDRQVKLRGFRIELEEIERVVAATALVGAVFVEKVGDGPGAFLAAFVLPARSAGPDEERLVDELRRRLGRQLPDYMVPGRWVVLASVPLGPTGKADRRRLLGLLETAAPAAGGGPDADSTLEALRGIWLDVLGVSRALPTDNFIEAGGNSILALQLASRVSERLAVPLEPAEVLLAESLADLAGRVRAAAHPVP